MKPICFYHSADLDGVCSAAIVKHFVPDCELYGIDYPQQDQFPWDKIRPGPDAETDPLWAHLFLPENWYEGPEQNGGYAMETLRFEKRTVYMVDFSLKASDMLHLAEVCNLVWIDHHRQIISELLDIKADGIRNTKFAACELCWMRFSPDQQPADLSLKPPLPEAVRLLGAYDSWRKDDPEWAAKILPFQYGMRALPDIMDPAHDGWQNTLVPKEVLFDGGRPFMDAKTAGRVFISDRVNLGASILRYQADVNRKACEAGAHEFEFGVCVSDMIDEQAAAVRNVSDLPGRRADRALRALACNTIVLNSTFFDSVYDPEKHDVMCAYCQLADGRWKVSLYSTKPEINCGAICKAFSGGGHPGAAGFTCEKLPWEN